MANWRGTWDSGTAYAVGDSVAHSGTAYYCVTANTGHTPGSDGDWALQDVFTGPGTAGVIDAVAVTGTPSSGQVITATSSSAAHWATPAAGVTLDTTSGDIAALGSQAAGAVGKAADAGHVHPATGVAVTANNLSDLASASTSRTNLGLGSAATLASSAVAQTANNLSDLASASTSRTNLGLGSAATLASSAVAQTANNLSDLASASTARTSLGLGSAATLASSAVAQTANNLSDLASASTARANLGLTSAATATLPLSAANGGTGSGSRNFAGLLTPTAVKAHADSPYAAAAGDFVPCDTTAGGVTVTLPSAPADLTVLGVKHVIQGGTNTVTINCGGSDVFNKASGSTSATLTLLAQGLLLQYRATGGIWYVVSDDLPLTQLDSRYAQTANNLSDVTASTARTNLGLGTAATLASSAVAQTANNLSDLGSASTSRTNLGLGTAATISSTAGGDLSGTLPSPTVAKVNGTTVPATPAVGQVLTATTTSAATWQATDACELYRQPAGANGATMARANATSSLSNPASGVLTLVSIPLLQGTVVSNITFLVSTTAASGQTHGWYALLDPGTGSGPVLRAASADQGSTAAWGTTSVTSTLAMTTPYTIPSSGLYYVAMMIVAPTTMPTFIGCIPHAAMLSVTPPLAGASSSSQTTVPTIPSTMAAIGTTATNRYYWAYTS